MNEPADPLARPTTRRGHGPLLLALVLLAYPGQAQAQEAPQQPATAVNVGTPSEVAAVPGAEPVNQDDLAEGEENGFALGEENGFALGEENALDQRLRIATEFLAHLKQVESQMRALAREREANVEQFISKAHVLTATLDQTPRRDGAVISLGKQARDGLKDSIDRFDRAMAHLDDPSQVPVSPARLAQPRLDRSFGAGETSSLEATKLEELQAEIASNLENLRSIERHQRWESVLDQSREAGAFYWLWLDCLDKLPIPQRSQYYKLSDEGIEQVILEFGILRRLMERNAYQTRSLFADGLEGAVLKAAAASSVFLRLFVVFAVWRWLLGSRASILKSIRETVETMRISEGRQRALETVKAIESSFPWFLLLLAVFGTMWAIGEQGRRLPLVTTALALVALYALYRLTILALTSVLTAASSRLRLSIGEGGRRRSEWSVRAVLKVAFVCVAPAIAIWTQFGSGLIFFWLRLLGVIATALAIVAIAMLNRRAILNAYLAYRAEGSLANWARSSRDRLSGLFVAPLVLAVLAYIVVLGLIKLVILRFDSTRGAGQALTRHRAERAALRSGFATGEVSDLPSAVIASLAAKVCAEDIEATGEPASLQAAIDLVTRRQQEGRGGSLLLGAESQFGKHAWLEIFAARVEGVEQFDLEKRILDPQELLSWLAERLVPGAAVSTGADLVRELNEGAPRVVVVSNLENLFLTTVNGYLAFAELAPIIDDTRGKVFWMLTIEQLAWTHLRAAGKDLSFLRRVEMIARWNPKELVALIDHRMKKSGVAVTFADHSAEERQREDANVQEARARELYFSVLTDLANGNPGVALHYFLRSLEPRPDGDLKVLPFRWPSDDEILATGEEGLFLLAALCRHRQLTVDDAAQATDYPAAKVGGLLARFVDHGIVDVEDGRFGVTVHWKNVVLQTLRRRSVMIA